MNKWVAGARPRTLPAAIVPVAVGTAAAVGRVDGGLIWWRAGAAMVVAGLAAEGETEITGIHHIDRGYDDLVGRLSAVGAHIERR